MSLDKLFLSKLQILSKEIFYAYVWLDASSSWFTPKLNFFLSVDDGKLAMFLMNGRWFNGIGDIIEYVNGTGTPEGT